MIQHAPKPDKVGKSRVFVADANAFVMGTNPFAQFDEYIGLSKTVDWEADPAIIGGVKLVPHGLNNDLPIILRDIMDKNNLAPGILEREMGLLYGDGPQLYRVTYTDGKVSREYVEDLEVQAWLDGGDRSAGRPTCAVPRGLQPPCRPAAHAKARPLAGARRAGGPVAPGRPDRQEGIRWPGAAAAPAWPRTSACRRRPRP